MPYVGATIIMWKQKLRYMIRNFYVVAASENPQLVVYKNVAYEMSTDDFMPTATTIRRLITYWCGNETIIATWRMCLSSKHLKLGHHSNGVSLEGGGPTMYAGWVSTFDFHQCKIRYAIVIPY